MRPGAVVLSAPALGQDLDFLERVEDLAIEKLVSEPGVEGFDVSVLPGTAWLDEERSHVQAAEPIADRLSRELRAVVGTNVGR